MEEEQNRQKLEEEAYQQRMQPVIEFLQCIIQKEDNLIQKYQQISNRMEDEKKHKDVDVDLNSTLSTVDDESSVSSYTTDYKDIDKDIDSDHEITEYGTTRKMREHDSIEKNGWFQLQQNEIEQYINNNRKDFMARDNFAVPLLNNRKPRTPLPSCKTNMNLFCDHPT